MSQNSSLRSNAKNLDTLKVFGLLAVVNWVAHFWHFTEFGLYEDDYNRVTRVMGITWGELGNLIFKDGLGQGRIFHDGLIYLFSFLGLNLGGLPVVYLFGYAIIAINSFLFYLLLKRVFNNGNFAVLGALAFCLFPADTTRPFLTHSLGVQPSLFFLLAALHLYFAQQKKLSYLVILGSLFCYEPIFPVFAAAPLLKQKWDSKLIRELLLHIAILAMTIVGIFVFRKFSGESRASSLGVFEALLFVGNPIVGPITSLSMYIYRPLTTLVKLKGELFIFLPLCFAGFWGILSGLKINSENNTFGLSTRFENRIFRTLKLTKFFNSFAKPVIIGLIMMVLAYPLTLSTLGFSLDGRGTRVHVAAIVGASIIYGCICLAILQVAKTANKKRLANVVLSVFFALLVGFGLIVQQDYKMSWAHQKAFWTDLVKLCPDLDDGTAIFIEPSGLRDTRQLLFMRSELTGVPDTRQIKSLEIISWVFPHIYQFPNNWQNPPKAYRLPLNWREKILTEDKSLQTISIEQIEVEENAPVALGTGDLVVRKVDSSQVIFLETGSGQLTRRTEPLVIGDRKFQLKQQSNTEVPILEKGVLYDYLIKDEAEERVEYLVSATKVIEQS